MELIIVYLVLSIIYSSTTGYQLHCKPKPGCDFSKCDPLPEGLTELEGFNSELHRRLNEYHITCEPVESGISRSLRTFQGQKGQKGDRGRAGAKGDSGVTLDVVYILNELERMERAWGRKLDEQTEQSNMKINKLEERIKILEKEKESRDEESAQSTCPSSKLYTSCATMCPRTCDQPEPRDCIRMCNPYVTCVCPPDKVLLSEEDDTCVSLQDCPKKCDAPKVYTSCATTCPLTCDQPELRACNKMCDPEVTCVCPPDMVQLSEEDDTCVYEADCPVKCESPKVFADCATMCPPTCDNPEPEVCSRACNSKVTCVCPPDMVQLSDEDDTCVYEDECPVKCESPKVFDSCATLCPPTCDDPEPEVCPLACNSKVICVCPPGMVQLSDEDDTCVYEKDCPVKCESPKEFTDCATMCPPTCYDPEPEVCSRACNSKVTCVCPRGLVQADKTNDTCIRLRDCHGLCLVSYAGRCFFWERKSWISLEEGKQRCAKYGGWPANIYGSQHYAMIREYILGGMSDGDQWNHVHVWLGMGFDTRTGRITLNDGSVGGYLVWKSKSWPLRHGVYQTWTSVALAVSKKSSEQQENGMFNRDAYEATSDGILCEF